MGNTIRTYHANGNLKEKYTLINSIERFQPSCFQIRHGLYQQWYINGQKRFECNYDAGNVEGLAQQWHENGQIYYECNYVADKREGLYQEWHANGQKQIECNYVAGIIEGLVPKWDKDGKKIEESYYVAGIKSEVKAENEDFKTFIKYGVNSCLSEKDVKCPICYEAFNKEVVIVSCCSFIICKGCVDRYDKTNCLQCRKTNYKLMTITV